MASQAAAELKVGPARPQELRSGQRRCGVTLFTLAKSETDGATGNLFAVAAPHTSHSPTSQPPQVSVDEVLEMVQAASPSSSAGAGSDEALPAAQRPMVQAIRAEFATGNFFYAEGRLDLARQLTAQTSVDLSAGASRLADEWPFMWNFGVWQELVIQGVAPDKWLVSVIRGHVSISRFYVDGRNFALATIARMAATGARAPWFGPGAQDKGSWPGTITEVEQSLVTDELAMGATAYMALPAIGLSAGQEVGESKSKGGTWLGAQRLGDA